ncbi:MAG: hypothetical protein KGJ02_06760 [Verrucomicrobiota bacterium]|nr:hypothetical protein [Verrucomicrobiota bacterium]
MICANIVHEIDKTLDQLIQNAEVISDVELSELSDTELEAFQKTQESLLQHLLHMDQFLSTSTQELYLNTKVPLQEKLFKFEELKTHYTSHLEKTLRQRQLLWKRRSKRFFNPRFSKRSQCPAEKK